MTTLQTRLAQADKPTRELLEEAFEACFPEPPPRTFDLQRGALYSRYSELLDAEAWTSAVEMLLDPDWVWAVSCNDERPGEYLGTVMPKRGSDQNHYAAAPALALAIACLKARGLA